MRATILALFVSVGSVSAQAQNAEVQQLIDAVNIDSLVWHLERLSGEVPVHIGVEDATIASRYQSNSGNGLAAVWLQQQFMALGYTPVVQVFGTTGANIMAVKIGSVHPERKVVICAHYDDMPGGPVNAPGADDNGSGVCAVLEAARLMSGHLFENTVVFALWDEEEQGSIGSAYYASSAGGNDEEIAAAVNMDAIGYDGNGDGVMRIYTGPVANSMAIKDTALMVNTTYGLDLSITIEDPGPPLSDHASFWAEGYGAIMIGEDYQNDLDPHYHTPTDLLQYMDLSYWHGLARLAIGTAAVMAMPYDDHMGIAPAPEIGSVVLQLLPNPARDATTLRYHSDGDGKAHLSIIDAVGRVVTQRAERSASAGDQVLGLDIQALPAGVYILRLDQGRSHGQERFIRLP
jgi:hypothetical protein